jgi:osmotically inducible lipoprotein OsmB
MINCLGRNVMKKLFSAKIFNTKLFGIIFMSMLAVGLTACSDMSKQETGTLVGAGAGAVVGSAVVGGSGTSKAIGAGVGAVAGGVIGHEVTK